MRKTLTIQLICILVFIGLTKSNLAASDIRIGLQANINYGFADYDEPPVEWDPGWAFGFAAGGVVDIPIAERFTFMSGLVYLKLQNEVDFDFSLMYGSFNYVHNYLALPVMIKYAAVKNALFIGLGTEVAYLLSAKSKSEINYRIPPPSEEEDTDATLTDYLNRYNISLVLGIGLDVHPWGAPVEFHVQYNHGVTGISKENRMLSDWRTREIRLGMVYYFNIFK